MTRILVTGATGFVGKQVLRALNIDGVQLIPVVRTGKEYLVQEEGRIEYVISTRDMFAEVESTWTDWCKGVDILIHTAWYAEPGKYLRSTKNIDCLAGSLRMAQGAVQAGVKRIVGIGSCAEYDQKSGFLSVETGLNPLTPYGAAKAALFLYLSQWLPTQAVNFVWCRLFYLYGADENENRLVAYLRSQLKMGKPAELTSGNQIRDFMNVVDASRKIAEIALSDRVGPVNVCSGLPITIRQLAENIADEYGRRDLIKFDSRPDSVFDPPCIVGIPNC
jgi:dTDP-6-deoxy-L-talose 4-dehydrogenase (NAD+)